jgi:adenylosuccinate lyase
MAGVLSGLRVYPERMRANLDLTGGLVFSHRVLLALVDRGLSREEAYRIVQDASIAALEGAVSFRQVLAATGRFSQDELGRLFDYGPYLAHVEAIFARVGITVRTEVTR